MRAAMGYDTAPMAMTLEVYASDAEAFGAAAALAAEHLRSAGARATVALAGGRSGRGIMVALAARGDLPWERVEWFWGDERCVPADDGRSNLRLARDSLLVPRGVAAGRIHPPPVALGDPVRIAAAYAATLAAEAPVFDLVLLGLGAGGGVASLVPGAAALRASAPVAAVGPEEVAEEPRVARITPTPPALAAARRACRTPARARRGRPARRSGRRAPDRAPRCGRGTPPRGCRPRARSSPSCAAPVPRSPRRSGVPAAGGRRSALGRARAPACRR